jgi:DNA adenine methylase
MKESKQISIIDGRVIPEVEARPFLKWAGGKRQLLPQMEEFFPKKFERYIEPFVGGGAVFFHLFNKGLIKNKAILIDINRDLINCYKVIKNDVEALIEKLKEHAKHKLDEEYYYKIRKLDRKPEFEDLTNTERAARLIYMNKVCYNGLYRVNSKGQFNVPFGSYKNPTVCDEENLIAVNKVLQNVELVCSSFEKCLNYAHKNDLIYLDPPYHPLSETSSFTSYTKEDFSKKSQKKLFNIFKILNLRKSKLMLSNSYHEFVLHLYREFHIKELGAKRAINSDSTKRGKIKVVLILNKYALDE